MRAYPELIRAWVGRNYRVLGTDGFGRSDTRSGLRDFFEIDSRYIALAALTSLAAEGMVARETVVAAIKMLGIDPDKANPLVD